MLHRSLAIFLTGCLLLCAGGPVWADNGRPTDRQIERFLLDIPTAQGAMDDSKRLNEEAHYPGSVGDKDMALWMRDRLNEYGFTTTIEAFQEHVPHVKREVLSLLENPKVDFDLKEAAIPADPDGTRSDAGTPFNGWSGSGDVTAPLVYANEGLPVDYDTLSKAGVSVSGRIVLIRYGAEFRGLLARRAIERGAAGVILYSDPIGFDGAVHGPQYPDGPYRPLGTVQRGSLGSPQVSLPVMPVSALTARRLLQAIDGSPSPRAWRGGLGADYALGATRVPVHMAVAATYSPRMLWNTIGVLPGSDNSHTIVLGGHRDAWVYGVTDNGSGISALLEAAHALGFIYRAGWRPRYSIVVAGWDGEEIGEAGSNAFVRAHYTQLRKACVAYVNADEVATGNFFVASGAAAISGVAPRVARLVPDPRAQSQTLWDKWRKQDGGVQVRSPGGGSDHEPFLYLVGIPTLELGFDGPFGVYHSAYDDLRYANTQADPNFLAHRAIAQALALLAFRITEEGVPYRFGSYLRPMSEALKQLSQSNGTGTSFDPIDRALDHLARSAAKADGRPLDVDSALDAAQRLDMTFYGREGYRAVAFPKLSEAMAKGDAGTVKEAVDETAAQIDAAASTLER